MRLLVTYDIKTHSAKGVRRLRAVARLMEGFGIRVQHSVFECDLTPADRARLEILVAGVIDAQQDSVLIYRLSPDHTLRLGTSAPDPLMPTAFVR